MMTDKFKKIELNDFEIMYIQMGLQLLFQMFQQNGIQNGCDFVDKLNREIEKQSIMNLD